MHRRVRCVGQVVHCDVRWCAVHGARPERRAGKRCMAIGVSGKACSKRCMAHTEEPKRCMVQTEGPKRCTVHTEEPKRCMVHGNAQRNAPTTYTKR